MEVDYYDYWQKVGLERGPEHKAWQVRRFQSGYSGQPYFEE